MLLNYNTNYLHKSFSVHQIAGDFSKSLSCSVINMGRFYATNGFFTERSGLENYLFFMTISGVGRIKTNYSDFELFAGECCLIDCNEYQYYINEQQKIWDFCWIHLEGQFIKECYSVIGGEKVILFGNMNSKIECLFEDIYETIKGSQSQKDLRISSKTIDLMSSVVLTFTEEKSKDGQNKIILKAIDYINENFEQGIKLEEIADCVHISKYYFSRLFKAYTGQSPYDYLINCRINNAKKLLINTDFSIGQIAQNCGFWDCTAFIKAFSNKTGMTPLKYRKAQLR